MQQQWFVPTWMEGPDHFCVLIKVHHSVFRYDYRVLFCLLWFMKVTKCSCWILMICVFFLCSTREHKHWAVNAKLGPNVRGCFSLSQLKLDKLEKILFVCVCVCSPKLKFLIQFWSEKFWLSQKNCIETSSLKGTEK